MDRVAFSILYFERRNERRRGWEEGEKEKKIVEKSTPPTWTVTKTLSERSHAVKLESDFAIGFAMASLLSPPPKPLFDEDYALTNHRLMGPHFVLQKKEVRFWIIGNLEYIQEYIQHCFTCDWISWSVSSRWYLDKIYYTVEWLVRTVISFNNRVLRLEWMLFLVDGNSDGKIGSIRWWSIISS